MRPFDVYDFFAMLALAFGILGVKVTHNAWSLLPLGYQIAGVAACSALFGAAMILADGRWPALQRLGYVLMCVSVIFLSTVVMAMMIGPRLLMR